MIEFIDKTTEQSGTPLNRSNLMGVQGFESKTTTFSKDSSGNTVITQTNGDNHTLTTKFNSDGSITETFVGEKTITKKTTFKSNGDIEEEIS